MNKKEMEKKLTTKEMICVACHTFRKEIGRIVAGLLPFLYACFFLLFLTFHYPNDISLYKFCLYFVLFTTGIFLFFVICEAVLYVSVKTLKPYSVIFQEGIWKAYCHPETREFLKETLEKDFKERGLNVIFPDKEDESVKNKILNRYKDADLDNVFFLAVPLSFSREIRHTGKENTITAYD